jgi:hypothetical protein
VLHDNELSLCFSWHSVHADASFISVSIVIFANANANVVSNCWSLLLLLWLGSPLWLAFLLLLTSLLLHLYLLWLFSIWFLTSPSQYWRITSVLVFLLLLAYRLLSVVGVQAFVDVLAILLA